VTLTKGAQQGGWRIAPEKYATEVQLWSSHSVFFQLYKPAKTVLGCPVADPFSFSFTLTSFSLGFTFWPGKVGGKAYGRGPNPEMCAL